MKGKRKWWKKLWRVPAGLFALSLLGTIWLERRMAAELERTTREDITEMRDLSATLLHEWATTQKRLALTAVDSEPLREAVNRVLGEPPTVPGAPASEANTKLRHMLGAIVQQWAYDGFYAWRKGEVVSAYREDQIGRRVSLEELGLSRRPLRGEALVGKPKALKLDASSEERHFFWTAVSVGRPEDDAFIAFRVSTDQSLEHLFRGATFGRTGESYVISEQGTFLTEPRFTEALRVQTGKLRHGRVEEGGVGNESRALTVAAQAIVHKKTGDSVKGYLDYRGETVVGAWTWLPELGIGLVTEVDRAEALEPLRIPSFVARAVSGLFVLVTIVLLVIARFAERFARRAAKAVRLGQYVLERKIGEGGMGAVYRARHALLRRPTAIKLLSGEGGEDSKRTARFEREVQLTAELCHPNTIQVYDYGRTEEGTFYYAMEFLEGYSLWEAVERYGRMPERRVLRILSQIFGSLAEAHERGLVHRDIKPANIMLTNRGGIYDFVKVLDFGLVKNLGEVDSVHLTQARTLTGTPQYMAPETILDSENATHLSDIYAVGCVAYYLLTGSVLFDGNSLTMVVSQHLTVPATPFAEKFGLTLHPEFEAFVLCCLEKDPTKRPQTSRSCATRLAAIEPLLSSGWSEEEAGRWWKGHTPDPHALTTIESQETVALELATRTGTGSGARSDAEVLVRQASKSSLD